MRGLLQDSAIGGRFSQCQKGIKRGSVTPVNRGQKSVVRGRIWPNVKKVPNGRVQGLDPGAAFAQGYGEPRKSGQFRLKKSLK